MFSQPYVKIQNTNLKFQLESKSIMAMPKYFIQTVEKIIYQRGEYGFIRIIKVFKEN